MSAAHPGRRTYSCADSEISIVVENSEQWHALAVCLGRPELAYAGAWDAVRVSPAGGPLADVVGGMFAEDTAERWKQRLDAHGVPCVIA